MQLVIKNRRPLSQAHILAPFHTPAALAARQSGLDAYNARCKLMPAECRSTGAHAD